jgi:hypothetical protein
MGRAAAEAVRRRCGNPVVLEQHLALRSRLVEQGPSRSIRLPADNGGAPVPPEAPAGRQAIVAVIDAPDPAIARSAARSVARLGFPATAVSVVTGDRNDPAHSAALTAAARRLLDAQPALGVALLPAEVSLAPGFAPLAEAVLQRLPEVGAVSAWVDDSTGSGFVRPCPGFPHQWLGNDLADITVFRREAFLKAGGLSDRFPVAEGRWALGVAILAAGWRAVSCPAILAQLTPAARANARTNGAAGAAWAEVLAAMRERYPREFERDAPRLADLQASETVESGLRMREALQLPVRAQVSLVLEAMRRPRRALGWLQASWKRLRR